MPRRSFSPYRDPFSAPRGAAPARSAGSHDARRVRLGPLAFLLMIGTLVIMAGWSITTAAYFAFREDVLTGLVARQAEMQLAYEDRIAELRAQIDRFSSRQLIDQEEYEKKLEQILRRQSALESRAGALNGLGDATAMIKQPARGGGSAEPRAIAPKASRDKGAF